MKRCIFVILLSLQCLIVQAVNVVFRFDDFRLCPDTLQEQLLETFVRHKIPISLAVIPCSDDKLFFTEGSYLAQLKGATETGLIEIAQHGLNHRFIGFGGEFAGISFQRQMDMLSKGKHLLDSLFMPIITFVPPWNSYDDNTLRALELLGFECMSSCMTIGQPLSSAKLQYYPETIDHPNKLINAIKDNKNRNGIIILMFHDYDFDDSFSMSDMDALLNKLNDMDGVECLTFKMLCEKRVKSDRFRFKANIEINLLSKFLKSGQMLQTKLFAVSVRIINLLIYIFIVLVFFLFGWFVCKFRNNYFLLLIVCVMGLVGIVVWWHLLTPLKAVLFTFLISFGALFGALLMNYKKKTK